MSSEHVEVLRHMKETIKAIMPSEVAALDAAIASLSAPQPPAEAQAPRDREADRARFRDEAFNAWLDTGISDAGHAVWDTIGDLADAWAGWQARSDAPPSAPVGEAVAWEKGYKQGILDERISEANIGIAGYGAKVEPARNNPYLARLPSAAPALPLPGDRGSVQSLFNQPPPAEAQAQGGWEVRAKPIEWMEDGGDWCDRHHGFQITRDEDWPQENSFIAAWGEGDAERFATLEEAQGWCQEAIDRYVREWAVAAPPSAPVGVEGLIARWRKEAEGFDCGMSDGTGGALEACADDLEAALAQQPAAVDGAMVERALRAVERVRGYRDHMLTRDDIRAALTAALAAQPGGSDNDR